MMNTRVEKIVMSYPGINQELVNSFWKAPTCDGLRQLASEIFSFLQAESDGRLRTLSPRDKCLKLIEMLSSNAPTVRKRVYLIEMIRLASVVECSGLAKKLTESLESPNVDSVLRKHVMLSIKILENRFSMNEDGLDDIRKEFHSIPLEIEVVFETLHNARNVKSKLKEIDPHIYWMTTAISSLENGAIEESRDAFENWIEVTQSHFPCW